VNYERSENFTGEPKEAIEMAQAMFVQSGYKIMDVSDSTILVEHQGGFLRTQSGHTIYAASPIKVSVSGNLINISAGYDGIEKAKRFITRLLVGLAFLLGLGMGIPFALLFEEKWPLLLALGLGIGIPLIQLPIHLYVTPMIMKKRADKALDTLIHNITMLAR
jgi:heme/copper-type cytochrome/quinol oxidase subunit 4